MGVADRPPAPAAPAAPAAIAAPAAQDDTGVDEGKAYSTSVAHGSIVDIDPPVEGPRPGPGPGPGPGSSAGDADGETIADANASGGIGPVEFALQSKHVAGVDIGTGDFAAVAGAVPGM